MLAWSVAAFATAPEVGLIVIAAPPGAEEETERVAAQAAGPTHVIVVSGGAARAESVGFGWPRSRQRGDRRRPRRGPATRYATS